MKLNPRQKLFVKHYVRFKNASKAARKAGYSAKTAGAQGHDLLKVPEIARAIEHGMKRQLERTQLTSDMVLAEIRKLAFVNLSKAFGEDGELLHPHAMPKDVQASLQSIDVFEEFEGRGRERTKIGETKKIKLNDKVRALEMLAKHFKLLTDVHEHSGKDGGPQIVFMIPPNGSEKDGTVPASSEPPSTQPDSGNDST